jgi:hypothetical protein
MLEDLTGRCREALLAGNRGQGAPASLALTAAAALWNL